MLNGFLQDVRSATRTFRSGRGGLLSSGVVLAVAIGVGTATFSIVSAVLLRSLPFTDPDRLVSARVAQLEFRADNAGGGTMSGQSVALMRSDREVFDSAAPLYGAGQPVLTGLGEPERVNAWKVDPAFFGVMGSQPLLGRVVTDADAMEANGAAVVVSHRFWVSRLGGASDAIGRTLTLNDTIRTIVGVMPAGFEFPEGAQLWQAAPPATDAMEGGPPVGQYWLVGRLAPGVSPDQARVGLDARFESYAVENPAYAGWGPSLTPLREMMIGAVRTPLLLLLAAVALVVLIACANVAAVLLARGVARRREFAIRLAIGATRARVARQLLTESLLLALLSGAGGVLLAYWTVPFVVSLLGTQLPRAGEISIDDRVLGAALAASILTGLLAGMLPALVGAKEDVSGALKDGSIGAGTSAWRVRMGEWLVVLQIGLGTLLMTGAMLLTLSFVKLVRADFGFDPERVVAAKLRLPRDRYASREQRQALADALLEHATAIPGVQAAAWSDGIPFDGGLVGDIGTPGRETPEGAPAVWITTGTSDYFRALGMRLLLGRAFGSDEREDAGAVVVNETFAKAYFPAEDPLGRVITYFPERRAEIVGVVSDVRQGTARNPPAPEIYLHGTQGTHLVVRTIGDPGATSAAIRGIIRTLDPELPIDRLGALNGLVVESVARERLLSALLSSFAVIALMITLLGTYGLTAYSVSRRTRELGIRVALGATRRHIRGRTVGRTALLAVIGATLGLLGSLATTRILQAYLYEVSTTDPRVFGLTGLLIAAAAILAACPPAWKGSRIDPMIVLRSN